MSFNLLEAIRRFFPNANNDTKIYFWGTNDVFRRFNSLCALCGYEIDEQDNCYLVDTDSAKWGQMWDSGKNKKVISPQEVDSTDNVAILTVPWTMNAQAIEQLEQLNFVQYRNLLFFNEFSPQLYAYIFGKSKPFKNRHRGEMCFIIGNGPSLRVRDLDVLHENNVTCFAANRIYEIFDQTSWRPKYYCVIDSNYLENPKGFDYMRNGLKCPTFINIRHALIYLKREANMQNTICLGDDTDVALLDICPVEVSVGDTLCNVNPMATVTFVAMQIAFFMGFSEIGLIGVDNFANSQVDHFYEDGSKSVFFSKGRDDANSVYRSAKKYANKNEIKIFNATRGGALEVFDRVDFDDLFKTKPLDCVL